MSGGLRYSVYGGMFIYKQSKGMDMQYDLFLYNVSYFQSRDKNTEFGTRYKKGTGCLKNTSIITIIISDWYVCEWATSAFGRSDVLFLFWMFTKQSAPSV